MLSWLNNKDFKKKLNFHKKELRIVLGVFGGIFTYVFSKLMVFKPQGLFIGQPNSWSDWVVHISITQIFANKPIKDWFLYHPFYANGKLTYGFLSHLITAMFMRLGLPIDMAFFVVSIILLFSFLTGLYLLYYQLSNSKKQSVLAIFLVFTSSGLGIFRFLGKISWQDIFHPTQDYSRYIEYEWLAGNIPEAMLIPQRAFFIGVAIGVWVLNLLLWGLKEKPVKVKLVEWLKNKFDKNKFGILNNNQEKLFFTAGVFAGILPIAHMHSFIVIVVVTGIICFSHRDKYKQLLYFVTPAGLISTALYFTFIHGGIEIDNFMRISLGWTAGESLISWITMWIKVWGAFLPIVFYSFYKYKNNKQIKKHLPVFIGFLVVFILANIITFQPTAWDNTKLFAWVYIGLAILVTNLLSELWKKSTRLKLASIVILFILSATGTVSLFRILDFEHNTFILSSNSEIVFAQKIAKNTKNDAIFLTSTKHNHPIPLWANRSIFLGYLGWVKNYGFEDSERIVESRMIYSGAKEANQLIIKNKISYIYFGPYEKNEYTENVFYLGQFPVAFENEDTVVYDTRQLWQ